MSRETHTYVERDDTGSGVATGMVVAIVAVLLIGVVALFLFFGGPGRFIGGTTSNPPNNTNINVQPPQPQAPAAPNINVQPPAQPNVNINPPSAPNVNINPPSNPAPANPGGNTGANPGAGSSGASGSGGAGR